ncbi:sel1 repeat family protein [Acinetobacter indicus]|uniref:Sel1 repeat family protein n=1 Tax=Acinetobacter indicus TaxID=756892 RepID=A0A6C0Y0Q2_9GAMM|nr:tetratricopeptide repeat protein [Acinetobacter indicus]QFS17827.1 sel1 repeat family protein [Acinetobacter indicus]QIC69746.1 sel1 repeat family protein [Acinetobacter indicus]RVT53316.1 sel1 repeat family protein [Acinetobacter indicus]UNW03440.1 sel1 repeat family protein [Acinetobacter indicus]
MSDVITVPPALINRALAGQADAQFELAELYMQSEHEDDNLLAEEWALKAAENGHLEAMYWLGEGYTVYAKDVQEDDPEDSKTHFELAYYWLKQASEQKHAGAILELAGYYRRGNVVDKDILTSVNLVQQAAELGDAQAMRDLACIYEHGLGVEINEAQADYWAEKAKAAE